MNAITDNPFDLQNNNAYQVWRAKKLNSLKQSSLQAVEIKDPKAITPGEYQALSSQVAIFNVAIFRLKPDPTIDGRILKTFGSQFDLHHLDSNLYANENDISELRVISEGRRGEYIPYTNRPLGWHTDGYYNHPDNTIRSFILYCINDASEGGANQLLDPELAYIHVRDQDSKLIAALMQPDVLTIPNTVENGKIIRPEQKGPVFQVDPVSGHLLMRYTQRKANIQWRPDNDTQTALSLLGGLLASDSDHILDVRLNPGKGMVCNNVLHNRSAFIDNPEHPRVMLRARYYDRFRKYTDA
jgi:alpha-ketoglutarate-dependent taurine dioxygenase